MNSGSWPSIHLLSQWNKVIARQPVGSLLVFRRKLECPKETPDGYLMGGLASAWVCLIPVTLL